MKKDSLHILLIEGVRRFKEIPFRFYSMSCMFWVVEDERGGIWAARVSRETWTIIRRVCIGLITRKVNYGGLVEFVLAQYSTTRILLTAKTFQCGSIGWLSPGCIQLVATFTIMVLSLWKCKNEDELENIKWIVCNQNYDKRD